MVFAMTVLLVPSLAVLQPVIVEDPGDLSVPEESPATLHCRTNPPSPVEWTKDGAPLAPSEGVLALPDGSLFLLATRARDAGSYSCQLRAGGRRVTSRPARLEVRYLRRSFGEVDREVEVVEGGVAVVQCLPPKGWPAPRVRWEREGEEVEFGRSRWEEVSTLVLENVRRDDAGTYTCSASNSEGEVMDLAVELRVAKAPSSTHQVILVERQEEELSLRFWVVAITFATLVTLALLALSLLVCVRYRRLSLLPTTSPEVLGSEHGSTSSYSSDQRLLYAYEYADPAKLVPSHNTSKAPIYRLPALKSEQHYASSPVVRPEYSRPFNYVVVGGRGQDYHVPRHYS